VHLKFLWLRLPQRLRSVNHPLRKDRRALRWFSLGNGPVVEPSGAFFSYVCVGQTVGLIAESVFKSDEAIARLRITSSNSPMWSASS